MCLLFDNNNNIIVQEYTKKQMNQSIFSSISRAPQITESCRKKYPHMIPIQISTQQGIRCSKDKFLISEKVTGIELQRKLIEYIQRESYTSLYFFIADKKKNRMLQKNVTMKQLYQLYRNQQGYLSFKIMKENVFGQS